MTHPRSNIGTKLHPASREMLPDDPLETYGYELPGDGDLMLRMLVEEYARMGYDLEALMTIFRDPFYQGPHGLWRAFGEERTRRRVAEILGRHGVVRVTSREAAPQPSSCELVQLELPSAAK